MPLMMPLYVSCLRMAHASDMLLALYLAGTSRTLDACRGVGVLLQADVELGAVVHGAHGIVQLLSERK